MAALPYFDEIDPSNIDVLLVTQYVFTFPFHHISPLLLFSNVMYILFLICVSYCFLMNGLLVVCFYAPNLPPL